jgi:hypothetical protein
MGQKWAVQRRLERIRQGGVSITWISQVIVSFFLTLFLFLRTCTSACHVIKKDRNIDQIQRYKKQNQSARTHSSVLLLALTRGQPSLQARLNVLSTCLIKCSSEDTCHSKWGLFLSTQSLRQQAMLRVASSNPLCFGW